MITRRTLLRLLALAPVGAVVTASSPCLVAQGDSLTRGSTLAYPVESYATIIARRMDIPLVQQAFSGSILATQAPTWLESPDGITVSLCGYNDMRLGADRALYELALTGAALRARARGQVYLGGCLRMTHAGYAGYGAYTHGSDAAVAAYNAIVARVAAWTGAHYVDLTEYDPDALGSGDEVHPSADGQIWIADRMMGQITRTYMPAARR